MTLSRLRVVLALALFVLLTGGCAVNGKMTLGMVDDPGMATSEGVHGLVTAGGLFLGSGVQWNEEYYVTARHVVMLTPASHVCNCDLKFVKRRSSGPVPDWREARTGEEIIAFGYNTKVPLSSRGKILDAPVIINNRFSPEGDELTILRTLSNYPEYIAYRAHNAPIMSGMSGGAVISAETGEILGMNISLLNRNSNSETKYNDLNDLEPGSPVSVFVPYSMIQASWDNYQRMQRGELRWQLPGQEILRRGYIPEEPNLLRP